MIESLVLLGFAAALVFGIVYGLALYIPLFAGFILFFGYGLYRKHDAKDLCLMSLNGLKTIGPILLLFVIIGMLTASWRAAGTIPAITCWSSKLVQPSSLIVLSFLLCCCMGLATGSAFASSATIGVICMTIGRAMGCDPALVGGAVLSGCYFGDRCSPMSGSAMLTATLTNTKPYNNINRMLRTALIPTLACVLIYYFFGKQLTGSATHELTSQFSSDFVLEWYVVLPTAMIIVLALLKVNVKKAMAASLCLSLIICVTTQGMKITQIPYLLMFGYHCDNPQIASMVNGGGILSMAHISLVIGIASTYSGLFEGTGLLNGLHKKIIKASRKTTPYVGVLLTSLITTGIACDQMLSIMLTSQLCDEVEADGEALALDILNSSSIVCALMPWTTSCMGCLAFMGAPATSCLYAFFPMLLPAWFLFLSLHERQHPDFVQTRPARLMGLNEKDDVRRFLDMEGNLCVSK